MKKVILKSENYYVMEDNVLVEQKDNNNIINNIYYGKIKDVKKSINAAFVDIEGNQNGYLPLNEYMDLNPSDKILVQAIKDKGEDKGAFLSSNICIKGKNLIVMSEDRRIKFSTNISKKKRGKLIKVIAGNKDNDFGVIVRSDALNISHNALKKELEFLELKLKKVLENKTFFKEDIEYDILVNNKNLDLVITDDKESEQKLNKYIDIFNLDIKVEYNKYIDMLSIKKQLSDINKEYIWLKCGGKITIDKTKAFNVIDVDTAKNVNNKNFKKTILETNLEAVKESVRQIRLRNLTGIILIDFINMKDKKDQDKVIGKFEEEFMKDDKKHNIHGFTNLGILEITRKNT